MTPARLCETWDYLTSEIGHSVKIHAVMLWKKHPVLALTHRGWVMHICASKLAIIGSDNGLAPDRPQAIIWTNTVILSRRICVNDFIGLLYG